MSTELYLNLLTAIIVILVLAGIFAYFYKGINNTSKMLIIWYVIVLILNIANIMAVMKFYMEYAGRKGTKGKKGLKGPRGFKGENNMCSSCGDAGQDQGDIYGSFINDNGEIIKEGKIKEGKCIFPFSYNYQYKYKCVKDIPPPGLTENDASRFGWCATKINPINKEPEKYAYCNANASLQDKQNKEKELMNQRKDFMKNNYGILDIKVFAEDTKNEAQKKCNNKLGYEMYDQDLNEGTDGKFVYLCIKKGYGSIGISDLKVLEYKKEQSPAKKLPDDESFILIDNDLNMHSGQTESHVDNQLYLYKKMGNKDYIKDINITKDGATCGDDYDIIHDNLNEGTGTPEHKLQLCISREKKVLESIDSAFVYTDGKLYIIRGNNFYKMTSNPIQKSIMAEKKYPKKMALKWGKMFNYNAVFTYGYNNKTYFFKGSKVYIYDDKKMKMTEDSPYNISDIFKGVPNNINAVFTWSKDNITYFFKGPFYYKYNDKAKKVESGYPKKSNVRWENMPPIIDAIFSLPFNMQNSKGTHSTYVISGAQSWFINPSNDILESQKDVTDRFSGIEILKEITTKQVNTTQPGNITTSVQ